MPSQSVLVIGGGLAGLSSAVALAEAGWRVCLLEKRPHLGGRATSYTLPDGSEVDNCQHVTLGCCTNLADFYRRVGAERQNPLLRPAVFRGCAGTALHHRSIAIAAAAPHGAFVSAVQRADARGQARHCERNARDRAARAARRPDIEGVSMLDWLQRMKQTPSAIERFWRVVLVSALDEELDRTDARYGIEVFWKAFLANKSGYRVGIPSVPLAELYEGCRDAVANQGGEVRLRCGVRGNQC